MFYQSDHDIPKTIRDRLSSDALTLFRSTVNQSIAAGSSETVAFAQAWTAIKQLGRGFDDGSNGEDDSLGDIAEGDARWGRIIGNAVATALGKKSGFSITGKISKLDEDQRLVFGWASIVKDKEGNVVKDLQNDVIRPEELEKSAYAYVLDSRVAGEMHKTIGVGSLVESVVFTIEKMEAMGIPEGIVPTGWWVGFRVDADVFAKIKDGTYSAFSIGGSGKRKVIEE